MGKQIHLKKVEYLFEKSLVVDFKSIARIIGSNSYARLLIYNLLKKNKIKKLGKGYYTKYDENSLAVFAFKPAYLGLQCALSHFDLWEQETIPVIITTKKIRRGLRKVFGTNILIRNINNKYFFGFKFEEEGNFYLPYSDIEKTFIDMVVFNQKVDDDSLKNIKKTVNNKILENYLKKYSSKMREKIRKKLR